MNELININRYHSSINSYFSNWNDSNVRIVKSTLSDTFRSLQIVNDRYQQINRDFSKISSTLNKIYSFDAGSLL